MDEVATSLGFYVVNPHLALVLCHYSMAHWLLTLSEQFQSFRYDANIVLSWPLVPDHVVVSIVPDREMDFSF